MSTSLSSTHLCPNLQILSRSVCSLLYLFLKISTSHNRDISLAIQHKLTRISARLSVLQVQRRSASESQMPVSVCFSPVGIYLKVGTFSQSRRKSSDTGWPISDCATVGCFLLVILPQNECKAGEPRMLRLKFLLM